MTTIADNRNCRGTTTVSDETCGNTTVCDINENVNASPQILKDMITKLNSEPTEEILWDVIVLLQNHVFLTFSGLPFSYTIPIGRSGKLNKELVINRRDNSKSLTWSSVRLAFNNALRLKGQIIEKPKAIGDIRGISYIYPIFYYVGLIEVPQKAKTNMEKFVI